MRREVTWTRTPTHHVAGDPRDVAPAALAQSEYSTNTRHGQIRRASIIIACGTSRLPTPTQEPSQQLPFGPADHRESEDTADATASEVDEDEDAEGEEDEENTENDAEGASRYDPSRSRSPPPPDPPDPDNGPGPNNEQDGDADADGDMDVDDKGTPPSGTSPATHQSQGGHHRQTVTFVMEAPISIKPSFNIPTFFLSAHCLTASPKEPSCVQHSSVSIHTIVHNVGNCAGPETKQFYRGMDILERDDSFCDIVCSPSSAAILIKSDQILRLTGGLLPHFQVRQYCFLLTRWRSDVCLFSNLYVVLRYHAKTQFLTGNLLPALTSEGAYHMRHLASVLTTCASFPCIPSVRLNQVTDFYRICVILVESNYCFTCIIVFHFFVVDIYPLSRILYGIDRRKLPKCCMTELITKCPKSFSRQWALRLTASQVGWVPSHRISLARFPPIGCTD
jgi:hypothetical protein